MTAVQDALDDIATALKEPEHYSTAELLEIRALQSELRERLRSEEQQKGNSNDSRTELHANR